MFRKKKTYLALYEIKDELGYHIDFTTMIRSSPPKPEEFLLRTHFTGRIIIFEIKEAKTQWRSQTGQSRGSRCTG